MKPRVAHNKSAVKISSESNIGSNGAARIKTMSATTAIKKANTNRQIGMFGIPGIGDGPGFVRDSPASTDGSPGEVGSAFEWVGKSSLIGILTIDYW